MAEKPCLFLIWLKMQFVLKKTSVIKYLIFPVILIVFWLKKNSFHLGIYALREARSWTVLKPWAGGCDTGWMNMLSHIIFGAGIVIHPNTYCYIQESEKKL